MNTMNRKQSEEVRETIKEAALNLDKPASQIKVKLDLLECSYLMKAMNHYQKNIEEIVDAHLDKLWKDKGRTDGVDRERVATIMKLGGVASMECVRNKISEKVDKKGWFNDD